MVSRGSPHFSLDLRFGTAAGFLDAYLEKTGAALSRLHAKADPLFGGQSPQCGEPELRELAVEIRSHRSRLGLACDGDADRFGVCDETGAYVQPNEILALLLHDRLGRKGRRGGVARSVATTHALDAIAKKFGVPLYETPVGFKYIGEKLLAGEIGFGGEESAGLTVEGHVPEKDGILADLLTAEMVGAEDRTIGTAAHAAVGRDRALPDPAGRPAADARAAEAPGAPPRGPARERGRAQGRAGQPPGRNQVDFRGRFVDSGSRVGNRAGRPLCTSKRIRPRTSRP